jgi:hypothetical protein
MSHSQFFGAAELADEDERPLEFSLDGPVGPGPYSSAMQNIFGRHCAEIRTQAEASITPLHQVSRKKLREIITKQNNNLFGFLQRPDRTPHTNGIAEAIFRRYGHDIPSLHRGTAQAISRELNLDISMNTTVNELNTSLERNTPGGLTAFGTLTIQLKWLFTQYKTLGEEILRLEAILSQKIETLDKLQQRTPIITGLTNNDALPELLESFGKYLEKVYQDSKIEDTYRQLAETYKKWNIVREIIALQSAVTETNTTGNMCSICLTETVGFAVVPCGHTFCTSCSRKMNMNCYICRGVIREKLKLYFN